MNLEQQLQKAIEQIKDLEQEIDTAVETLKFYAMGDFKMGVDSVQENLVKLMIDDGKLAREALKKLGVD